ncbi:MAG: hypothetical protein M5U28_12845 [Sandaracinaceae bacterium]|nr:hypothetical protein [Sandaracinaceae bacterium]
MQLGEHGRALELYDEIVAPPPGDFRDVSNAASLLARLEEAGVGVAPRWRELAERAAPYCRDHGYAFADAHYALTLMRAGRRADARALLASMRRHALGERAPDARVLRELGLPLVEGILALEEGRASDAFEHLAVCADGAPALGGSHAQRELFRRLWIAAARSSDAAALERAASAYLRARPRSAWAAALLAGSACAAPAE